MTRTFVSLGTSVLLAAGVVLSTTAAGCSGAFVPIADLDGSDESSSGSGSGGSSSGGASGSGVGGSSSGTGGSSSSSGGHSSSSGASSSSSGGQSSSSGGSSCCPANWNLHGCRYPDGGAGLACHNPLLGCASSLTCGQGCDRVVTEQCGGSSSSGGASSSSGAGSSSSGGNSSSSGGSSSSSGGTTGLQWYPTCGPPVVGPGCLVSDGGGPTDDAGAPCPPVGSSCSTQGELCGTPGPYACPVGEICSNQPMRVCPVSSRKYKDNIEYVDPEGLQQLHDETLGIRLATYNYKAQVSDPNPRHLGFIIEDRAPQSSAVDWTHERVDLYGYMSMVVATMQVQEKEIAELRRELELAREGVCAAPNPPAPR